MTVGELISILEPLDHDVEVVVYDYEWATNEDISVWVEDGAVVIHQAQVVSP